MRRLWRVTWLLVLPLALHAAPATDMNTLADRYIKLVLAVGQHDDAFVDAYYGPPEWKTEASTAGKRPLADLGKETDGLAGELAAIPQPDDPLLRLRREYLRAQVHAVSARIRMLQGARLDFDAESRELYDAVAPTNDEAHFAAALAKLESLVPGG